MKVLKNVSERTADADGQAHLLKCWQSLLRVISMRHRLITIVLVIASTESEKHNVVSNISFYDFAASDNSKNFTIN